MARVVAYYDFGSPYAYLGWQRTRVHPAPYEGHEVEWKPVSAGHIFQADSTRPNVAMPNQGKYLRVDVARWAKAYDVPWCEPDDMPTNALGAMRLSFVAMEQGLHPQWMEAVFLAYFGECRDITRPDILMDLAKKIGMDASEADMEDPEYKRALVENTTEAYDNGCPGVPFFLIGDDTFWGQDRLSWVEARLQGRDAPDVLGAAAVAPSSR